MCVCASYTWSLAIRAARKRQRSTCSKYAGDFFAPPIHCFSSFWLSEIPLSRPGGCKFLEELSRSIIEK